MATSSFPSPSLLMIVTSERLLGWTQGSRRRPADFGKQRTMYRLSTFALKPTIEPNNSPSTLESCADVSTRQRLENGLLFLGITFDDIDKQWKT